MLPWAFSRHNFEAWFSGRCLASQYQPSSIVAASAWVKPGSCFSMQTGKHGSEASSATPPAAPITLFQLVRSEASSPVTQVCGERPILPSTLMPTQTRLTRVAMLLAMSRLANFSHPLADRVRPRAGAQRMRTRHCLCFPSLCRPWLWANCKSLAAGFGSSGRWRPIEQGKGKHTYQILCLAKQPVTSHNEAARLFVSGVLWPHTQERRQLAVAVAGGCVGHCLAPKAGCDSCQPCILCGRTVVGRIRIDLTGELRPSARGSRKGILASCSRQLTGYRPIRAAGGRQSSILLGGFWSAFQGSRQQVVGGLAGRDTGRLHHVPTLSGAEPLHSPPKAPECPPAACWCCPGPLSSPGFRQPSWSVLAGSSGGIGRAQQQWAAMRARWARWATENGA